MYQTDTFCLWGGRDSGELPGRLGIWMVLTDRWLNICFVVYTTISCCIELCPTGIGVNQLAFYKGIFVDWICVNSKYFNNVSRSALKTVLQNLTERIHGRARQCRQHCTWWDSPTLAGSPAPCLLLRSLQSTPTWTDRSPPPGTLCCVHSQSRLSVDPTWQQILGLYINLNIINSRFLKSWI